MTHPHSLSQGSLSILSRQSRISFSPSLDQALDDLSAALSMFVLDTCNRQMRPFHLSSLADDPVVLNSGQGVDYSVDISKTDAGEKVAVKYQKVGDECSSAELASAVRKALDEIAITSHGPLASCPNIIDIVGFGWDYVNGKTALPALVVEFADVGTLRQYLAAEPMKSDKARRDIFLGIIDGLEALHNSGIIHGDVKLENVLMKATGAGVIPKIADFGSAIVTTSGKDRYQYWGTHIYNAPEVRACGSNGSFIETQKLASCDIWSLGLLCLETALDGQPYASESLRPRLDYVEVDELIKMCLHLISQSRVEDDAIKSQFASIISSALQSDPAKRAKINAIRGVLTDADSEIGTPELFQPHYSAEGSIIDLADSITIRAILKGRGASTFRPERPPWSVLAEIAERYQKLSQNRDDAASGFASLNLAICYYIGLGVERNFDKVGLHMHEAALKGFPEAIAIIRPLSELLGFQLQVEVLEDAISAASDDELETIISARKQVPYKTPFYDLNRARAAKLSALAFDHITLNIAALLQDSKAVQALLDDGVEDLQDENGETALLVASVSGNLQIAKILLAHGSRPSLASKDGYTPLHMLCMFTDTSVAEFAHLLQEADPDLDIEAFSSTPYPLPDFWDSLVGTPLQWAVAAGSIEAVKVLLDLGSDPTHAPGWLNPIQLASSLFQWEILDLLLQNTSSKELAPELHGLFFLNEGHPFRPIMLHGRMLPDAIRKTVALLASDHGVDVMTTWGQTPLMKVAISNTSSSDKLIVQELLRHCDKTINGPDYSTIEAGIIGRNASPHESASEITLLLIDAGFSTRAVSSINGPWPGWNAMHWAAADRSTDIVKSLYSKDPELLSLPTEHENKELPLHVAANSSYGLEIVELLLNLGADACAFSGVKATAVTNLISESRLRLDIKKLDVLLQANAANGYVVLENGSTVVHMVALRAARLDQEGLPGYELLQYILDRPEILALVNKANNDGLAPLHFVCCRPDLRSVSILVQAGADLNVLSTGSNPMSPLGMALEHARAPLTGWAGKNLADVWHVYAYEVACYLSDCMAGTPRDKRLTRLHMAAYCAYTEEVERLVAEGADLLAENADGFTPVQMLMRLLHIHLEGRYPIDPDYLRRAKTIMTFLAAKQMESKTTANGNN